MLLSVSEQNFPQEVFEASTPVLVHFWAPWCGLCRLIVPQLRQFEADWKGQVKLVAINADQNLKLASKYRLQTLPTLILFEGNQVVYRLDHFQGRDDLRRNLEAVMANYQSHHARSSHSQAYLSLEA